MMNFKRNLNTGSFECEILIKEQRLETAFELKPGTAYLTQPEEGTYQYIFKILSNRDLVAFTKIRPSASKPGEDTLKVERFVSEKVIVRQLRKMLNKLQVFEEADDLFNELQTEMFEDKKKDEGEEENED